MALFVDLEEDEPPHDVAVKHPVWNGEGPCRSAGELANNMSPCPNGGEDREEAHEPAPAENLNRNSMTVALGCYPIIKSVAASIDLNDLDSLSRTCRQIRAGLLQHRKILIATTLRCYREDPMADNGHRSYYRTASGEMRYSVLRRAGQMRECARDMVSECRRCGTVICRNCTAKPPAPAMLHQRHRRLCTGCTEAPIAELANPPLRPGTLLEADLMRQAICHCDSDITWLCTSCGHGLRAADLDYQAIWRWRNQYGDVWGGLGTGIGSDARLDLEAAEMDRDKEVSPAASASSVPDQRPPKPDREVHKNSSGLFPCTWPGCDEPVQEFSRKCEWSKHMDKHERPYRCLAQGCEKLAGFTYSGGLLRHEREVHGKHGGPRNPLHCPHVNCKRHSGKGFSRQENLNEHLRRVHTGPGTDDGAARDAAIASSSPVPAPAPLLTNGFGDDHTDDGASDAAGSGSKRKRAASTVDDDIPEVKRLKQENEELKRQIEAQNLQVASMLVQLQRLRGEHPAAELLQRPAHPVLPSNAPPAQML